MEEGCKRIFQTCEFDKDMQHVLLDTLKQLGVNSFQDLQFVLAEDLISAGVQVVPSRKFMYYYTKDTSSRKSSKIQRRPTLTVSADENETLKCDTVGTTRSRSRSRTRSNPWMKDTRDSVFSKQMHCLSQYVTNLRESLNSSKDILRSSSRQSLNADFDWEPENASEEPSHLSQTLPPNFKIKQSGHTEESTASEGREEIVPSCSLVEYQALIDNISSPLEVVKYLRRTSRELNEKIGGAVCPADPNIIPDGENQWLVNIKWALPMDNFALEGAPDPDELAMWIIGRLPPKDPTAMNSCKGIFVDLDMSFFSDLTRKAYRHHSFRK